jgi:hypothetical protein
MALGLIVGPGNGAREASLAAPAMKIIPAQGVNLSRFKWQAERAWRTGHSEDDAGDEGEARLMLVGPLKPKHFVVVRDDGVGNVCLLLLWRAVEARNERGVRGGGWRGGGGGGGNLDARGE